MSEESIELPTKAVDRVIKELESGMRNGETCLEHDEVRPSAHMMAMAHKDAYETLIDAHPEYELAEADDG